MLEYYNAGMVGIGKQYADLMAVVGEKSGLTKEQIEVVYNYFTIRCRHCSKFLRLHSLSDRATGAGPQAASTREKTYSCSN